MIHLCALTEADRDWANKFLLAEFGSLRIVTRGRVHRAEELPGLVGLHAGVLAGLLLYHLDGESCDVVSLHAAVPGVGKAVATEVADYLRDH